MSLSSSVSTLPFPIHIVVVPLTRTPVGRRIFVDILDCYLRANLAVNNGFLDEVHFIVHTEDQTDIAWLEDLVATDRMEPYYKVMHDDQDLDGGSVWGTFPNLYGKYATDEDTLYVKIDDDMVWLDDNAIPHLVSALLAHPEAHSVQANVINSQWSQYFREHLPASQYSTDMS